MSEETVKVTISEREWEHRHLWTEDKSQVRVEVTLSTSNKDGRTWTRRFLRPDRVEALALVDCHPMGWSVWNAACGKITNHKPTCRPFARPWERNVCFSDALHGHGAMFIPHTARGIWSGWLGQRERVNNYCLSTVKYPRWWPLLPATVSLEQ